MPTSAYWDCETDGVDDGSKITCASVIDGDGNITSFHSKPGSFMSKNIGVKLLEFLLGFDEVYTFNGTSFDYNKLHQLTGDDRCKSLAKRSCDVMLQFTAESGYFSSMGSFAEGTFGANGIGKSNTGGWAATAWFQGQAEAVVRYCEDDVKLLKSLVDQAKQTGLLNRKTKSGIVRPWVVGTDPAEGIWKSASECITKWQKSPPNTSWMDNPPDLLAMSAWMF